MKPKLVYFHLIGATRAGSAQITGASNVCLCGGPIRGPGSGCDGLGRRPDTRPSHLSRATVIGVMSLFHGVDPSV
ncbi:hypothetical protein F4859DRAFT_473482 [Xylaria cf. heliscus]|nr:hypothetical protein F4859DRAFT_473482 [Xylaria cf. heliscus]